MSSKFSYLLFLAFGLALAHIGTALEKGCFDRTETEVHPEVISVLGNGILYSPGFLKNENYPDDVLCAYQLTAPQGKHVRIHFNFLEIDLTDMCSADALQVFDFNEEGQGVLLSMICGNQAPSDFVSRSHALQLRLVSDGFAGRRGFNISYSLQDSHRVCLSGQKECRNRNCVEYSVVCDGNDDCGDGTDEEKCPGVVLEEQECGKPDIDPLSSSDWDRIVGGKEAAPGSWPWMADMQMNLVIPNGHICGASLINAQWILTAAHCFDAGPAMRHPSGWRIHLGNHHKFKTDPHEQVRYAERIVVFNDIPSEKFEDDGLYDIVNDMALIKLNAPIKFSKYVKPICLADSSVKLDITSNCYATGWGVTRGTGSTEALKQAYHPVQQDILCKRRVQEMFHPETMICAGSMAPLNGACHGDSGGPLACETSRGKWAIAGVASYVTDTNFEEGICGLSGRPTVFNKVSVKIAWIRRMINKYS